MTLALTVHRRSDNVRGILAMLASVATFVVNDTPMKIAPGQLPGTGAILIVAAAALLAGQYWLVAAMRTGGMALVWQEHPDFASWAGLAIVAAAGLYTFLREPRLARAARA
jgi:hypothetical protein